MNKIKCWGPKVRACEIPHESEASVMFRNFFLMLIKNTPKNHLIEESYIRRIM
jgi:hypothetical protein